MLQDRLAIFTSYPSVTKDQALEETVLTMFHPVVHCCFQFANVTIEGTEFSVTMSSKANSQK